MKNKTGGPAFPREDYQANGVSGGFGGLGQEGMSLREYFAAKAMQALVTSGLNTSAWEDYADLAKSAYNIADEMIKARHE